MKICTMTFHKVCNNGAALQAYALMEYLITEGHDVEIIDYQPKVIHEPYRIFFYKHTDTKNLFKILARETISPVFRIKNRINYNRFHNKYLKVSSKIYKTIDDLKSNYPRAELYICGSDQIWNDEITGGIDKGYFLQFGDEKTRKISYAASFGKIITGENLEVMMGYLKGFEDVSIREKESMSLFNGYDIEPKVVLDPVFLLSKEQWSVIGEKRVLKEPYLLIYALCPGSELYISAKKIAKEMNIKIVEISNKIGKNINADKNFSFTGPSTFISLFYNSDFVITNSFHGTAFSIIFKKQFYSFPHNLIKERNGRILNLLENVNCMDRFIDYGKVVEKNKDIIDYTVLGGGLEKQIEESKKYLINNLK